MPPTKEILFEFSFKASATVESAPFGIAQMLYSTSSSGQVGPLDYVALALDYVPRVFWAFESQRQLPLLHQLFAGPLYYGLPSRPLPASTDWHLVLHWCQGLRAQIAPVPKPQVTVTSTVVPGSQLPRSLRNLVRFSLFHSPTFNMHLATLNAVLEVAALCLEPARRPQFNAALGQLLEVCFQHPGFWNGLGEGSIRSMQVVDEVLEEYGLA